MKNYGYNISIPSYNQVSNVTLYEKHGNRKVEVLVLTNNDGEEKMIPVIRDFKNKEFFTSITPSERKQYFFDISVRLVDIVTEHKIEYVVLAPSKSSLNYDIMVAVNNMLVSKLLSPITILCPFKKNLEKDIQVNEYACKTKRGDEQTQKNKKFALSLIEKLQSSTKESSTKSISTKYGVGARRYCKNLIGIINGYNIKQIEGKNILFFDDSLGEGATIRDCVPLLEQHFPNSIVNVVLFLDRADNKKQKIDKNMSINKELEIEAKIDAFIKQYGRDEFFEVVKQVKDKDEAFEKEIRLKLSKNPHLITVIDKIHLDRNTLNTVRSTEPKPYGEVTKRLKTIIESCSTYNSEISIGYINKKYKELYGETLVGGSVYGLLRRLNFKKSTKELGVWEKVV